MIFKKRPLKLTPTRSDLSMCILVEFDYFLNSISRYGSERLKINNNQNQIRHSPIYHKDRKPENFNACIGVS